MTEPRSSNSGFFSFLLLSSALVLGWFWLGQIIWPKVDNPADQKPAQVADAAAEKVEEKTAKEQEKNGDKDKAALQDPVIQAKAKTVFPLAWKNTPEDQLLVLGADDGSTQLKVWLDPMGAVVRQIRLTKFEGADSDGKATGDKLDLVPRSPIEQARDYQPGSFGLVHYPKASSEQPTDELLKRTWVAKKSTYETPDGKTGDQVSFETEIDGVRLTKTFRLSPGNYHLDLKVSAASADGAEHPFRYQLIGPRGLPLEGDWYVQVFRNAVFGLERDGGAFERNVHDMRTMATTLGSDPAPLGGDPGSLRRLRYAGIQTQYFASIIALKDPKSVPIRHTQATVEAAQIKGTLVGYDPGLSQLEMVDSQRRRQVFRISRALADRFGGFSPDSRPILDGKPLASRDVSLLYTWEPESGPFNHQFIAMDIQESSTTNPLFVSDATVRLGTEPVVVKQGAGFDHEFVLYNGPAKPSLMSFFRGEKKVDPSVIGFYTDSLRLSTLVDYPSAFGAWFLCGGFSKVVIFFTNLLHQVLGYMHLLIPSYGLCIILLTVLVRLSMFPISKKQALSNLKMQALAPQLKEIQSKYKGDAQTLARAQMDLYKKYGINPASGCLPVFLQAPIFMGLYWAFQESIELRLHPLELTWIKNLAAPDMLWHWGESIPLLTRPVDYGGFIYLGPFLNLLPLFAMGLMVVQQKMFMPPPTNDEMKTQQNVMLYMSIFMSILFYRVPAGLCMYFITSSLWGLTERQLLKPAKNADLSSLLQVKATTKGEAKPSRLGKWLEQIRKNIEEQGNPRRPGQGKKR